MHFVMLSRTRFAVAAVLIAASAFAAPPEEPSLSTEVKKQPPAATAPTTRPATALLLGTYRGTVVDDDETVPCVTTFRLANGELAGSYTVREGDARYDGTLDGFVVLSDARGICRFRWHDKNGEGYVTVHVTPDGSTFEGSWGLEVVQEKLVWTGARGATPRSAASELGGKR